MTPEPDYNQLYETAESQAGYFTARQAKKHGFSWERLSDNVKRGRFLRLFRGVYRLAHFPFQRMKICLWPGYGQARMRPSPMRAL